MKAKTNENKNKHSARKKLIPAVAMLTTSAIMLSTATYAWFTMNKEVEVTGINLTGITYEKVLSYVSNGCPVISRTESDEYIVIIAYNSSEIAYIDSSTGEVETVSMTDAGKMFSKGGNVFVTYFK